MTARFWVFTLNNPDGIIHSDLNSWLGHGLRYACYQHEVGEEGTEHFQGYLELDRGQRLSYVQRWMPYGTHLEQRRGTQAQAIEYCKKAESRLDGPWEFGIPTQGQGTRIDIAQFKEAVDQGWSDLKIWDEMPGMYLKYQRMLNTIRSLKSPKRSWKSEVIVCYGKPGAGKSTWVTHEAPDAYWKDPNSKWFNGYEGQEDVVFDDYKSWLPWTQLMQVLDKHPLQVETKGGMVNFVPRRIFITTNFLPDDWYHKDPDNNNKYPLEALTRRVDSWKYFEPGANFPEDPEDLVINSFDDYDSFIHSVNSFTGING